MLIPIENECRNIDKLKETIKCRFWFNTNNTDWIVRLGTY